MFTKRTGRISVFGWKDNIIEVIALFGLFGVGLHISSRYHPILLIVYLTLWVSSYFILYIGTCRYCAYYGKSCPVPLEGSLVCRVVKKSDKPFTFTALFYATIAYLLRVGVPLFVIVYKRLLIEGIIFVVLFILFWAFHLMYSACPNCINYDCPLNPGK